MPTHFDQYAISWVPQLPDPLAQFGAAWTGWCAERGEDISRTLCSPEGVHAGRSSCWTFYD